MEIRCGGCKTEEVFICQPQLPSERDKYKIIENVWIWIIYVFNVTDNDVNHIHYTLTLWMSPTHGQTNTGTKKNLSDT